MTSSIRNPQSAIRNRRPAVIVMAKAPRAGEAKTRLVPPLAPAEAASLAAAFVRDVVEGAARAFGECIIAYSPADGRATLEALLPPPRDGLRWVEQGGGDLGARLERVAAQAAAQGFAPLLFLGADSPTLPASFVEEARAALVEGEADFALGPADDGGYYLVALRRPFAGLFRNVSWSTPRAFDETAANAARLGLRVHELPRWYDVDTPADLLRLRDELFKDEEARRRAPSTYEWLCAHAHFFAG